MVYMATRQFKLKKLLNNTPESFYWLGFILADGHLTSNGRLTISQRIKDRDRVYALKEFVGCGNIREEYNKTSYGEGVSWCLSVMDISSVEKLKEKYLISNNKTISPPDLSSLNEEDLFCVMMGYTDGDGSMRLQTGRTDCILQIKCHSSWRDTLSLLYNRKALINKEGYACLQIADNEVLREWKRKALKLNLPISDRKWDMVRLERKSRYLVADEIIENYLYLKELGMRDIDISRQLDISKSRLSLLIKRKGHR